MIQSMAGSASKSDSAVTACVLGVLGFLSCDITSLPAVVYGHRARSQIRRSRGTVSGGRLAVAGLIMGYTSLLLGIAVLVLVGLGGMRYAQERAGMNRTVSMHG